MPQLSPVGRTANLSCPPPPGAAAHRQGAQARGAAGGPARDRGGQGAAGAWCGVHDVWPWLTCLEGAAAGLPPLVACHAHGKAGRGACSKRTAPSWAHSPAHLSFKPRNTHTHTLRSAAARRRGVGLLPHAGAGAHVQPAAAGEDRHCKVGEAAVQLPPAGWPQRMHNSAVLTCSLNSPSLPRPKPGPPTPRGDLSKPQLAEMVAAGKDCYAQRGGAKRVAGPPGAAGAPLDAGKASWRFWKK